ncbi:hypothetical protein SEVIR_5G196250v4 [Setaria viridis]|uniref:DNA-directed RNA polymerase II subunit RPB9-like zinc ribbon domain-containing protein n=1 Tax=Setaria viridis TaxID=4556 RepID=A0A4U6UFN0_SETVI|nr:hypothetical protein SEVIR_5G196250v2 [Setaria viridis]
MSTMKFCRECNNILYPKEDGRTRCFSMPAGTVIIRRCPTATECTGTWWTTPPASSRRCSSRTSPPTQP